jgi:hypothetical protein
LEERRELEDQVLLVLASHVGKDRAIGMVKLQEEVFGAAVVDRINDTRPVRDLVDGLHWRGYQICATKAGYFLGTAAEFRKYSQALKDQGLRKLGKHARLERLALPELLGQLTMELAETPDKEGKCPG